MNELEIYPVIEMSPWRVDGNDIPFPDGMDYSDFAIDIYKRNGIKHIETLDQYATHSIKISDIHKDDLKVIIEKELEDAEIDKNGLDCVGDFEGGLVIKYGNEYISHQCCGSIADYREWLLLLKKAPSNWTQIWIGHPWIYGRIREGKVELSQYIEHTGELEVELDVKMKVSKTTFRCELENAIKVIMDFKDQIREVLQKENSSHADELSELLIENIYPEI